MKGMFPTLYTSVKNKLNRRIKMQALSSALISVFLVLFNIVYTHFSYGQYSLYMRYMFLFPLIMCCFIPSALYVLKQYGSVNRLAFNLWNASAATFVFGCIVKGIIEISGRQTDFERIYFSLGSLLAVIAVITVIFTVIEKKKCTRIQN